MRRSIYLADPKLEPYRHSRINPWLRANNVDPSTIVLESVAHADDGYLTVAVFIFNDDGSRVLKMDGAAGYLKEFRTVPMLSAPKLHGL